MIEAVDKVPMRAYGRGRRQREILEFLNSDKQFGLYKFKKYEVCPTVYRAFRVSIRLMGLQNEVEVMMRHDKIYFVRKQGGKEE